LYQPEQNKRSKTDCAGAILFGAEIHANERAFGYGLARAAESGADIVWPKTYSEIR
jgi:hypothetical protein